MSESMEPLRDIIIRVDANVINLTKTISDHILDDKENFGKQEQWQFKQDDRIKKIEDMVASWGGAIIVVLFLIEIFFKVYK